MSIVWRSKITAIACFWLAAYPLGAAQNEPFGKTPNSVFRAAELDQQAGQAIQAKRFAQAESLLRESIRLDPSLVDARENLALVLLLGGNDAGAERAAEDLLVLAPDSYNGRLVAGVAAINQNEFTRGRSYLGALITEDTPDPIVMAAYLVLLQKGSETEAAKLKRALTSISVNAHDALLAGQIFREKRLRLQAVRWLEAIAADRGADGNPEALSMLAGIYVEQHKLAEASELYLGVIEANPDNFEVLVDLSEVERQLGERNQSASHLFAAKKLAGSNPASLIHFSQVCARRHLYVDARDALQKVTAEDSRNREAWYELGLAQFRIGEALAAERDFRTALGLSPQDEWSRIGLAAVLMSTGRSSEAEDELHRVLQKNPQSAAAHYYLGEIYRDNGQSNSALRQLEQAVTYARQDARPWAALGRLQLAQHQFSSARTSLLKAIDLDPESSAPHYFLAMLLRQRGNDEEAKREIAHFSACRDEEKKKGIVGLVSEGKWDYAGFLPAN